MIIPQPVLERIPYSMHGLGVFAQITYKWKNPPKFLLFKEYVITLDDGLRLFFPSGFIIDGASVPRLLWPLIEPTGVLLEGSVPHDFWYQFGYFLAIRGRGAIFSRRSEVVAEQFHYIFGADLVPVFIGRGQKFGDQLLKGITIEKHGATWDANRAYLALRLFGGIAYNKYRRLGPAAYTPNNLGFPGLRDNGLITL